MEKVTFSIRKGVQIQSKTTCFVSMKAYENKKFCLHNRNDKCIKSLREI